MVVFADTSVGFAGAFQLAHALAATAAVATAAAEIQSLTRRILFDRQGWYWIKTRKSAKSEVPGLKSEVRSPKSEVGSLK
jgi:hypothetical protein